MDGSVSFCTHNIGEYVRGRDWYGVEWNGKELVAERVRMEWCQLVLARRPRVAGAEGRKGKEWPEKQHSRESGS